MTRRLLVLAAPLTLLVVAAGAYTRLSDAGLGCPDWPACYGQLIGVPDAAAALAHSPDAPLDVRKAWIEVGHRYVAGLLGLLILVAAFFAVRQKPVWRAPLLLAFLVIGQSLLGMLTVTEKLRPIVVSAHLLGGMSIMAVLGYALTLAPRHVALLLARHGGDQQKMLQTRKVLRVVALWSALLLFVQIFSGGWVSANYAALACPDFPFCHGGWLPPKLSWDGFALGRELRLDADGAPISSRRFVHYSLDASGMLALITTLVLLILAAVLRRGGLPRESNGLLIILGAQIMLGIMNVAGGLPLWSAVLHNVVAALLVIKIAKTLAIVYYPAELAVAQ